jgi:hypothetical protein
MIDIYIHAGIEKTGTSAIQAFLNFNRENLLRDHSCLYPDLRSMILHRGHNCHNHCRSISRKDKDTIIHDMERTIAFCRQKRISRIIISCESFFSRPDISERIMEHFRNETDLSFRIIVFFRRQDYFFEASWKQWGSKDIRYKTIYEFIENFMEKPTTRWLDNLKRYESIYGKQNIIIHPYEREQLAEGLIPVFLSMAGIDFNGTRWITPPDSNLNRNDGFSRDILEILTLNKPFNKDIHDVALADFFYSVLPEDYKKKPYERYNFFSPSDRIRILEKYADMNRTIAHDYLGRDDGMLFYEPWPDPGKPWESYEGLTIEKIVPVFSLMLYNLHRRYHQDVTLLPEKRIRRLVQNTGLPLKILDTSRFQENKPVKKTLYVHIGAHKTGTTAIQSFLADNRCALEKEGYLYPGHATAHHDMAREFRSLTPEEIRKNPDLAIHRYFYEINSSPARSIILSCETFCFFNHQIPALKQFLGNRFEIKIIFYVRRQDDKIESAYNESVKNGSSQTTIPFSEYLRRRTTTPLSKNIGAGGNQVGPLDYFGILTLWSTAFGRENISVRCYEEEQLPGGIYQDFMNAIGLTLDERFRIPEKRINERLSWDLIEIIRICNARVKNDKKFHNFLVHHLIRINSDYKGGRQRLLSPQQRRDLISFFEESNASVAREYLGRSDGRLFYAPLPDLNEPWTPYEGLTVEKVVPVFIRLMYNLDKNPAYRQKGRQEKSFYAHARGCTGHTIAWIREKLTRVFI